MALQLVLHSWTNCVAVISLHPFSPARTNSGSGDKIWLYQYHVYYHELNQFQILLWWPGQWRRISHRVQGLEAIHSMWGKLFECKWSPFLPITSKSLPRSCWLCLPNLSAKWNQCQHIVPHNGYRLPRTNITDIRLHWVEGWKFWEFSTYGKALWKWQQWSWFHADHSKPLENQVKLDALKEKV